MGRYGVVMVVGGDKSRLLRIFATMIRRKNREENRKKMLHRILRGFHCKKRISNLDATKVKSLI